MRRTKDESEQTRRAIVEAARSVFARQGVAHTSLDDVARAAGVTRGAIYWHFTNKAELFNAMREQVTVPLVDHTDFALLDRGDADPLDGIERFVTGLAQRVLWDERTRATLEIVVMKCEYVHEFAQERTRQAGQCTALTRKLARRYQAARRAGTLRRGLSPDVAALETSVFVIGLLRVALIADPPLTPRRVRSLIVAHMAGRRRAAA